MSATNKGIPMTYQESVYAFEKSVKETGKKPLYFELLGFKNGEVLIWSSDNPLCASYPFSRKDVVYSTEVGDWELLKETIIDLDSVARSAGVKKITDIFYEFFSPNE